MKGRPAMKGRFLLVAAVALLARPALADDLTAAERAWVRTCVTGLTAVSARQRESAAAALTRLGPSAVPAIAASTAVLKTDDQWGVLEAVLSSMGPADAVKALEAAVKEWPEGTAGRRQALIDHLKAATPKGIAASAAGSGREPPKSPDAVAAKVREILDSFEGEMSYSGADTRIIELARLGRPAVSAMLEDLRRHREGHSFRSDAAAAALEGLLVVDDVPTVARMLADGHLDVAPALARLPADVVVPVLIAPLADGFNSFKLLSGLEPFQGDPRVPAALIRWLGTDPDTRGSSLIGSTAGFLADAGTRAAVPVLLRALDRSSGMSRRQVAEALVGLGEKRGIEALLDLFRAPAQAWDEHDRHAAGQRLNRLLGRRVYEGTSEPGKPVEGNFNEASRQFDAWWAEVKDTIRFDPERRAWMTK